MSSDLLPPPPLVEVVARPGREGGAVASLRRFLPRLVRFALVGALGTVVNLLVMALLVHGAGEGYVLAAIIAAEVSIVFNFVVQEKVVFGDVRGSAGSVWRRFVAIVGFNNVEAALRLPLLVFLVEHVSLPPVPAQALLLAGAFLLRFAFASKFVYRPRPLVAMGGDEV